MRKISGQLLSSKPVTLSRAAKLISRFAAVENGSSATVSLYLQRTADAFNNLVQFHSKRLKTGDVESSPERKRAPQSPRDRSEMNSVGKAPQYSNGGEKTGGETVDDANPNSVVAQNLRGEENKKKKKKSRSDSAVDDSKGGISNIEDEVQNLQNGEQEQKKKKKKRKSDSAVDVKEENIDVKDENISNAENEVGNLQSGEKEEEKTKKKKKRKSDAVVPKEEQQ